MIRIPLPHTDITKPQRFALVDDVDRDLAVLGWSLHVQPVERYPGYKSDNIRVRRSSKTQAPKTETYLHREIWLRSHGSFDGTTQIKYHNGNPLDCRRENLVGVNYEENQRRLTKRPAPKIVPAKLPRSAQLTERHSCPNISGLLSGITYRVCALRAEWVLGIWRARFAICESCPIGIAASKRWPQYKHLRTSPLVFQD